MDELEECTICHQKSDQMLMLTCVHDPCIECALTRYAREPKGRRNAYTCEICGQATPLDISSIVELERMLPQGRKTPHDILNRSKRKQQIFAPRSPPVGDFSASAPVEPTPVKFGGLMQGMGHSEDSSGDVDLLKEIELAAQNAYRMQQVNYASSTSRRNGCQEHEDEEVSYYCFGCLTTICPECAIHGSHQGHEVKQIKKAIGDIKEHFINVVDRVQKVSDRHKARNQSMLNALSGLADLHIQHRRALTDFFDGIRNDLARQEAQLMAKLEELHRSNVELVKHRMEEGRLKKDEAEKLAQGVLALLKKDELTILEEYGKRTADFNAKIEKYEREPHDDKIEGLRTVDQAPMLHLGSDLTQLVTKLDLSTAELKAAELGLRVVDS